MVDKNRPYPFQSYRFSKNDLIEPCDTNFETPFTITRKAMVQAVDMLDQMFVDEIIKTAREAGVTDLYLMDKKFIVEAIQEKLERMNNDEGNR